MNAELMNPSHWTDWLELALVIMGAATILVTALQKTVDPLRAWAHSTKWSADDRAVAVFAAVINVVAASLQGLKSVLAVVSVRTSDVRHPRLPPKNSSSQLEDTGVRDLEALGMDKPGEPRKKSPTRTFVPPGTGVVLLAAGLALSACGHRHLKGHAIAAEQMANVITTSKDLIEAEAERREREAVEKAPSRDEAKAAVFRVRARFQPVERLYEAVRVAHLAYMEAIIRANAQGRGLDPMAAGELLQAWTDLRNVAGALGVALPESPVDLVRAAEPVAFPPAQEPIAP